MYQLLIVDDEKEIRDGLASWTWSEHHVQVAGCCSHGLEALQFVSEQPVDIVMTDIRMPFMDGLELMEALHQRYPFIKVIILSGYGDFEYAQKAIQLGAVDYLLKPVNFPDLGRSIQRLVERLDEERQKEQRMEVLARKAGLLTKVLRESFLSRLFETPLPNEVLEQDSGDGELLLEAEQYTAAILRLDRLAVQKQPIAEKERNLIAFSLDNILNDIWDARQYGYHLIDRNNLDVYLLSKDGEKERFQEVVNQLQRYIGLFKSTFSAGIGIPVSSLGDIYKSVKSARQAIDGNDEEGALILGTEADDQPLRPHESGDEPDRTEVARDGASDSIILQEAKRYIEENYHRSLTLKEVAEHVYVSPGHLSSLFKASNETFLKYLSTIRINKAKELLRDNRYKIYEIVEMVGYSDPAYFSEVFKKYTGKTPNEYRGKGKHDRGN